MRDISAEIHEVSQQRQACWANGADPIETGRLARKLADLYEEKRILHAQERTGKTKSEIIRQARVESELERLISR